jgi:hypothetical protein
MTRERERKAQRAEQLESWHKDKAVQDNIVESWVCIDCGVNTHPGCPDGPHTRNCTCPNRGELDQF